MNITEPKVSVIIPVYNAEQYLSECLNSVVNQTLKNIEIICVDDGSGDNSLNILQQYADKDERIKIFTQKNLYAGVARNKGLEQAKGKYVYFLDADDFIASKALEGASDLADRHNSDVVIFGYKILDEPAKMIYNGEFTDYLSMGCAETDKLKDMLFDTTNPASWNKLYKRQLIIDNNIRYIHTKSVNDFSFTYLAMACSEKISFLNKTYVMYRVHDYSLSANCNETRTSDFLTAVRELKNKLIEKGLFEKYKRAYINKVIFNTNYEISLTNDNTLVEEVKKILVS